MWIKIIKCCTKELQLSYLCYILSINFNCILCFNFVKIFKLVHAYSTWKCFFEFHVNTVFGVESISVKYCEFSWISYAHYKNNRWRKTWNRMTFICAFFVFFCNHTSASVIFSLTITFCLYVTIWLFLLEALDLYLYSCTYRCDWHACKYNFTCDYWI